MNELMMMNASKRWKPGGSNISVAVSMEPQGVFYQNVECLSTEDYSSADQTPTSLEVFPPETEM
jgi:hypothetical protein